MKTLLFCTLCALLFSATSQAQNAKITHRITHAHQDAPTLGRDCWFSVMDLGQTGFGTYYALYLTSPKMTTVHIHTTGGVSRTIALQPYQSAVFNIPVAWAMTSSGVADDFGIHVWSNDADISCYVMEHGPYGSDGMYILPTIGWGTEYVVAAYGAYHSAGIYHYDLPSVFAIVANQDNTRVSITPACDLRVESSSGGCCSCLAAHKGVAFQVVLNAGQSVQFKSTCEQDCVNFDVTGTVITSNNPIGVEAGAIGTEIPCTYSYTSPVFEMIPPVRTWGKTYYSVPFYQSPSTAPNHNMSSFLVIATRPGQVIRRYDNNTQQDQVVVTFSKKYEVYSTDSVDQGSRWRSDAPFLLVQYMNSSTYPTSDTGVKGEPSEVILAPSDSYSSTVLFQTPPSNGNQIPFTNYVNIIANTNDQHVFFDGNNVKGLHSIYIDGIYSGYRASNVKPGAHLITSDSGVGVYLYGYGSGESYAWPGLLPTGSFNSLDTTPPHADTSGQCYTAHINLSDLLNGGDSITGIWDIRVDSIKNMNITIDSSWMGNRKPTSLYDMWVTDPTKPAILVVSVFDMSGNRTTITSSYVVQTARIGPPEQDFGVGNPNTCIYMYDTLVNTGKVPYVFKDLHLVLADRGFTIDSAVMTPLAVGESRRIRICFKAIMGQTVYDTIRFGDACGFQEALLIGSGGQADFRLTSHDWGTVLLGTDAIFPSTSVHPIEAVDMSPTQPVTIDSMWVDDPVHFVPSPTPNWVGNARESLTLTPPATKALPVTFTFHTTETDQVGPYTTLWHAWSKAFVGPGESGIRSNVLTANVVAPDETFAIDIVDTVYCPTAQNDSTVLQFVITATGTATSTITKVVHTSPDFQNLTITRDNGSVVPGAANINEQLSDGQHLYVSETFFAPLNADSTAVDTIFAYALNTDGSMKLIGGRGLIARIVVIKCNAGVESHGTGFQPRGTGFQPVSLVQADAGLLRATLSADWSGPVRVQIENVLGARVLDAMLDGNTIDASQLATGVYFYRLTSRGTGILPVTAAGKIIIQR